MDAWEQLISHSSLPDGDAHEHLMAQEAGGSGTILYGDVEVELDCADFIVDVDYDTFEIEIEDNELVIEIEASDYVVEICDG